MSAIKRWRAKLKQRGPVPVVVDAVSSLATLATVGVPVPAATARAALEAAWETYKQRKADDALRLLAHELRSGHLTVDDLAARQETAAMVFMLLRAAMEGAARVNLRVLAKALRGYAVRGETDEERYAHLVEIIKFISRQKLIVLAAFHKVCQEMGTIGYTDSTDAPKAERLLGVRLVPEVIGTAAELRAILGALTRTGFVATNSVWASSSFNVTPLADEVVVMAPLREALADEDREPFFAR